MKKEKKISKEKVDSYINKIKAEVKEREKRYGSNKIMKTASRIETASPEETGVDLLV